MKLTIIWCIVEYILLSFCPQFAAVLNTKKAKIRQLKELGTC